jgi:uncharacterized protein YoxC
MITIFLIIQSIVLIFLIIDIIKTSKYIKESKKNIEKIKWYHIIKQIQEIEH